MAARTTTEYEAAIKETLSTFWKPGDILRRVGGFRGKETCQMCGDRVGIFRCHILENERTGKRLIVGRRCIVNCIKVVEAMGHQAKLLFPPKCRPEADWVNAQHRGSVVVEAFEDDDDLLDDSGDVYDRLA